MLRRLYYFGNLAAMGGGGGFPGDAYLTPDGSADYRTPDGSDYYATP
jgi:hypothetical protein